MTQQKQKLTTASNLRVGILFNQPTKPLRGEDIDYVANAEVEEAAEAVQKAVERLDLHCQMLLLEDDIASFY